MFHSRNMFSSQRLHRFLPACRICCWGLEVVPSPPGREPQCDVWPSPSRRDLSPPYLHQKCWSVCVLFSLLEGTEIRHRMYMSCEVQQSKRCKLIDVIESLCGLTAENNVQSLCACLFSCLCCTRSFFNVVGHCVVTLSVVYS